MKPPVHVVCAGNSRYMMPLTVMLVSLVDNFNRQRDLVIHIISNDATAQDRINVSNSIKKVRSGLEHIQLEWHSNDSPMLERLHIPGDNHFSSDTYARLFIADVLPESCERVIYLDGDMIVLSDVSELFDFTADDDVIVHAAHDLGVPWVSSLSGVFDYKERGISPDARNFSAAVLVIQLKRWRERKLTPAMLDYLVTHGDKVYVDQGTLNAFLWQDWKPLDNRWNQGPDILFEETWLAAGYSLEEWRHAKNNPHIIHYAGNKKPWKQGRFTPRFSYFHHYLKKTVYSRSIQLPVRPEVFVGFRIYYRLWQALRKLFPGRFTPGPTVQPRPHVLSFV